MKSKTNTWARSLFIFVALISVMSLLLSACQPTGDNLSGGAGSGKGQGGGKPEDTGKPEKEEKSGKEDKGNDNKSNGQKDKNSDTPNGEDPTGDPTIQNPKNVDVRGSKQDASDPCLDANQLPCGQGDHGKGNPVNGSAHANCRAAQGEVDPVCETIPTEPPPTEPPTTGTPPVCEGAACTPVVCEGAACNPPPPPIKEVKPAKDLTCPNWIMFHTFRSGDLEVFRLNSIEGSDGTESINLSKNGATDSRPSRSQDGKWVIFQSTRNGNVELYLTDSEGNEQVRLTETQSNNINAAFGPDNRTIVFQSDRNGRWDIYKIDKDSGEEIQLTSGAGDNVNPFWSPDANWITYQSNRTGAWNIYVFDVANATEYRVTNFSMDVINPSWSPNGKQIAFFVNTTGTFDLYVTNIQGNSFKQISIGGDAANAAWAPQGDRLAYQVTVGGNTDVYTYDLVTNTEYKLTDFKGSDSAPSWNCLGTEVVFTSLSEGNPDLFSTWWMGGSPITRLTNNPSTDKWSAASGKETGSRGY